MNRRLKEEHRSTKVLRRSVDQNEGTQIADIRAKAERAIAIVQDHAKAKRAVLDSDTFSLERRSREAENLESFLELQKKKLLPVEFITFWGVHKRTRDSMTSREVVRPCGLDEVKPDIQVGSEEIHVETTAPYHPYGKLEEDEVLLAREMAGREGEVVEEEEEYSEEEEEEDENVSEMMNCRRHSLVNKKRRETIIAFDEQLEL